MSEKFSIGICLFMLGCSQGPTQLPTKASEEQVAGEHALEEQAVAEKTPVQSLYGKWISTPTARMREEAKKSHDVNLAQMRKDNATPEEIEAAEEAYQRFTTNADNELEITEKAILVRGESRSFKVLETPPSVPNQDKYILIKFIPDGTEWFFVIHSKNDADLVSASDRQFGVHLTRVKSQ